MQTEQLSTWRSERHAGASSHAFARHRWDGTVARDHRSHHRARQRAKALGWLGLAAGLLRVVFPSSFSRALVPDDRLRGRARVLGGGVREIACAIGILSGRRPHVWLWGRVVGDVVDVAMLVRSLRSRKANRPKLIATMASVAGILVLDAITAATLTRRRPGRSEERRGAVHIRRAITVHRPPEIVYRFWQDFENLPRFMVHLDSVRVANGRSHWRAGGSAGARFEWDAEVSEELPNELLVWRSVPGSEVTTSGKISFVPAVRGQGTEVHVELRYGATSRDLGSRLERLFGNDPETQLENDLRRFKQVIETGDIVHSDASIHRGPHPARPPSIEELEVLR